MTVSKGKGAKAKADRLFSRLIRSRGNCQKCGDPNVVTAHIIGRRFSWTRTNEDNAWALCPSCHYLVDNYADEKMLMVGRTIGHTRYRELRELAQQSGAKFDWPAEVERLEALLAEAA